MTDLPETLELRGSRRKWFGMLALTAPFTFIGIFMITEGEAVMGWICTIFFGLCALIFILQLIKPGRLTLGPDGFEQVMTGRTLTCRWEDVSDFGVYAMKTNFVTTSKFVCFNRRVDEGKRMAAVNQALVGATAQLSDSFGMKTEALADLMNAFRARALGL